jgi:hypothetical protein
VETVAGERLDAGDPRQLGHVQRSGAGRDELGRELISPVGPHDPALLVRVPLQVSDLSVEERVVGQPVLLGDPLAVLEDLRGVHVPFRRHVPGLLQQRHVDHRGGVALRARVAVPVPGTAEAAALLHDPHILDARFPQPCAGHQPGEPAADEGEGDVVAFGLALGQRCVRVAEQVRELPGQLEVLVIAVGPQPLGPLAGVALAQRR